MTNNQNKEGNIGQGVQSTALPVAQANTVAQGLTSPVPTYNAPVVPASNTFVAKSNKTYSGSFMRKLKVFLLLFFVLILLVSGAFLVMYFSNIDTNFANITLEGYVYNQLTEKPIADAVISDNKNISVTTDATGHYLIEDLSLGDLSLVVKATDYKNTTFTLEIKKSMFNYKNEQDFVLIPSSVAGINGRLLTNQDFKFTNDEILTIGDQKLTLNEDGTYSLMGTKTGNLVLKFTSPSFDNFEKVVAIQGGENKIDDITLSPSGIIQGELKSYVKEDIVSDIKFLVNNVTDDQILLDLENGIYTIEDLEIGKTYQVRVQAAGYNERDYEIVINQGLNKLYDFKLVETGNAVYVMKKTGDKGNEFYKSNFDGTYTTRITNESLLNPENIYFDKTNKKLMFQSEMKGSTGVSGEKIKQVFTLDMTNGGITAEISDTKGVDQVYPNIKANIMLLITKENRNAQATWYISDLKGENRKVVKENAVANPTKVMVSDDGNWIYYIMEDSTVNPAIQSLYKLNVTDLTETLILESKDLVLFDISPDGLKALITSIDESTKLEDFILYNASGAELRTIFPNHSGNQYQFLNDSDNLVLYWKKEGGRDNVYIYNIETNTDDQLTKLTAADTIVQIYTQDDYLYYILEKGLYILDIADPHMYKLVTSEETSY